MQTLGQLGELSLIARLRHHLHAGAGVVHGIGDDCAVVRTAPDAAEDLLLTSDAVIEGRHFLPGDPPADIGGKAIGRALSDIAAMGGIPRWALVDLVAPSSVAVDRIDGIYAGMAAKAQAFRLSIVGGDTTEGPTLELHLFAVGSIPSGTAILRSGARPGDALFVTGALGGSRLGRHLRVTPRIAEGQWLRGRASAMIDVSDGLATDLRHLLRAGNVGATLESARIPVSPDAARLNDGRSPLEHALRDGEDFELLFTAPAAQTDSLLACWAQTWQTPCTMIGHITASAGELRLRDASGAEALLAATGFEHFSHGTSAP